MAIAAARQSAASVEPDDDDDAGSRRQPGWYKTLIADLNASVATTFILHGGGTSDYAVGASFCAQWIARRFAKYLDTVVIYNIGAVDEPLTFPQPDMKRRYEELVGRRQSADAPKRQDGGSGSDAFALLRKTNQGAAAQTGAEPGVKPPPSNAVEIVRELLRFVRVADRLTGAVIIERLDLLAPPSDKGVLPEAQRQLLGMLHAAGTDPEVEAKGNPIVMLSPTMESIHSDLRGASSGIRLIEVPLPDAEARQEFISFIHRHYDDEAEKSADPNEKKVRLELPEREITAMTAGLYRRHIHDVWLRGVAAGVISSGLVLVRKNEIMMSEYAEVLETMQPRFRFEDIGGNDIVKDWLIKHIVGRMQSGRVRRLPKGVVFTGPSGTGKSLFAEALAAMLGINLVLLRPEKIKGGIYGETEQKVARAMAGIRANTPCVVFIDEIDQRFRRGGGAGGAADAAEDSIFGRILEEIGDPGTRGSILWIGATNRPKLCDAALFRPGRFDEKIPILPPVGKDRPAMFQVLLKRHADFNSPMWVEQPGSKKLAQVKFTPKELEATFQRIDWEPIVERSNGWTGAEMEQAVISAYDLAELDDVPLHKALRQAVDQLRPSTRDITLHRDEALAECNRMELVPPEYRALMGNDEALQASQEELVKRDELRAPRARRLE